MKNLFQSIKWLEGCGSEMINSSSGPHDSYYSEFGSEPEAGPSKRPNRAAQKHYVFMYVINDDFDYIVHKI